MHYKVQMHFLAHLSVEPKSTWAYDTIWATPEICEQQHKLLISFINIVELKKLYHLFISSKRKYK